MVLPGLRRVLVRSQPFLTVLPEISKFEWDGLAVVTVAYSYRYIRCTDRGRVWLLWGKY